MEYISRGGGGKWDVGCAMSTAVIRKQSSRSGTLRKLLDDSRRCRKAEILRVSASL